jgi:DNA (cytosine-5)-methyltransferase 1
MKFGSVCSGIEAASVAWHPLGWTAAWLSEIEPFPCAVLKHHYPDVPNHGDMTLLPEKILSGQVEAPDLFCGGTPCQAFSVAGLRNSLDDARGNLSLTFVGIANAIDHVRSLRGDAPAIVFWENVPGVLNTKDNAFGCFLGALAGESDPITAPGERWSNAGCVFGPQRTVAWRVLDAQYFGVAQRRRRVFVVASSRDDINLTEILFEFEGLRRDTPQSRKEGKVTPTISSSGTGVSRVGFNCEDEWFIETPVVGALDTECGGNKMNHQTINSGHLLPVKSFYESSLAQYREANVSGTIKASGGVAGGGSETFLSQPIAFEPGKMKRLGYGDAEPGLAPTLRAEAGDNQLAVAQPVAVYENHPSDSRVKELGDVSSTVRARWGTGGGNAPMVAQPLSYDMKQHHNPQPSNTVQLTTSNCATVRGDTPLVQPMVWDTTNITSPQNGSNPKPGDPCFTLAKGQHPPLLTSMAVRRLTPVECERLQGFPDNYTNIPWRKAAESPDGPRYKALGNSWAVPVVAWIGQRIQNQLK